MCVYLALWFTGIKATVISRSHDWLTECHGGCFCCWVTGWLTDWYCQILSWLICKEPLRPPSPAPSSTPLQYGLIIAIKIDYIRTLPQCISVCLSICFLFSATLCMQVCVCFVCVLVFGDFLTGKRTSGWQFSHASNNIFIFLQHIRLFLLFLLPPLASIFIYFPLYLALCFSMNAAAVAAACKSVSVRGITIS